MGAIVKLIGQNSEILPQNLHSHHSGKVTIDFNGNFAQVRASGIGPLILVTNLLLKVKQTY